MCDYVSSTGRFQTRAEKTTQIQKISGTRWAVDRLAFVRTPCHERRFKAPETHACTMKIYQLPSVFFPCAPLMPDYRNSKST